MKIGDIDVENVEVEGATKLSDEGIYKDIEDVAKIIKLKRISIILFFNE